eukprot:SAG11_NODE_4120_length_2055_cov_34.668712_1_plen_75_part_10
MVKWYWAPFQIGFSTKFTVVLLARQICSQKSRGLEYLTLCKRIYILKADIQGFPTVPGSRTGDKTGPLNFVSAQQ